MWSAEFTVSGMTCGHCEMSVREEVGELRGVTRVEVSAQSGSLVVSASESLATEQVIAAVREAGYKAVAA